MSVLRDLWDAGLDALPFAGYAFLLFPGNVAIKALATVAVFVAVWVWFFGDEE